MKLYKNLNMSEVRDVARIPSVTLIAEHKHRKQTQSVNIE